MRRISHAGVFLTFLILVISLPSKVMAQPDPRCDPKAGWAECCAEYPEAPTCPIDGGVVALLAAGVGYGIKRARDSRAKKDVVSEC